MSSGVLRPGSSSTTASRSRSAARARSRARCAPSAHSAPLEVAAAGVRVRGGAPVVRRSARRGAECPRAARQAGDVNRHQRQAVVQVLAQPPDCIASSGLVLVAGEKPTLTDRVGRLATHAPHHASGHPQTASLDGLRHLDQLVEETAFPVGRLEQAGLSRTAPGTRPCSGRTHRTRAALRARAAQFTATSKPTGAPAVVGE